MKNLRLSTVYPNVVRWGIVYHIQPNSEQVEMVREKFFVSAEKAWKWFHKHYKMKDFIQPEVVRFTGFDQLVMSTPSFHEQTTIVRWTTCYRSFGRCVGLRDSLLSNYGAMRHAYPAGL